MSERAAGNEAPIVAAFGVMIAYDRETRVEPMEVPQLQPLARRSMPLAGSERMADRLFEGKKAVLHLMG